MKNAYCYFLLFIPFLGGLQCSATIDVSTPVSYNYEPIKDSINIKDEKVKEHAPKQISLETIDSENSASPSQKEKVVPVITKTSSFRGLRGL